MSLVDLVNNNGYTFYMVSIQYFSFQTEFQSEKLGNRSLDTLRTVDNQWVKYSFDVCGLWVRQSCVSRALISHSDR